MKRKIQLDDEQPKKVDVTPGDKVSFSSGRKISDGNYGSFDVHCSVSTEVRVGEGLEEAMDRAIVFVEKTLAKKVREAMRNID